MGQYYKAVLISDDGVKIAHPHYFNNGLKLMEHSWIGNDFVNAVLKHVDNTPTRIAWIGDYADGLESQEYCFADGYVNDRDEFMKFYKYAWGDEKINMIDYSFGSYMLDERHADCYIVNLTRNSYIDMEKYVAKNAKDGWCVNPLPLLTAVGNGRGCGDYRGEDACNSVGSWAFDKIYVTALKPRDIAEVMYTFQE